METKSSVVKGSFLSVGFLDGFKSYLEINPPEGTSSTSTGPKVLDVIVVLDCSGSMSGSPMKKCNQVLQSIFGSEHCNSITIIRFGSDVAEPVTYTKNEKNSKLTEQNADLGGTNFTGPIKKLLETLKSRQTAQTHGQFAIFMSDGECWDDPTPLFRDMEETLCLTQCPLLSVAITTNVDPKIMVGMSRLYGDTPMILIKNDDEATDYEEKIMGNVPSIGFVQDIFEIKFLNAASREVLATKELKYKRGTNSISIDVPDNVDLKNCALEGQMGDNVFTFSLIDLVEKAEGSESEARLLKKMETLSRFLLKHAKEVIGQFIVGDLSREEAEKVIVEIRNVFNNQSINEEDLIQGITGGEDVSKLTKNQIKQLNELRKSLKAFKTDTQYEFNKLLETVGRNDLKEALEAYSAQTMTVKFNKRVKEIAAKNEKKATTIIDDKQAKIIMGDSQKAMPSCVLWLVNPYDEVDDYSKLDQGEWVGAATLVEPGKTAAVNPWSLKRALMRPVTITNTALKLVRISESDGQRKATVRNVDYGQFNTSIPVLRIDEHPGAVRLALYMMTNSTSAQKSLSDLICGTPELYTPPMVNALYVVMTLSSLVEAQTELDYKNVAGAFMVLLNEMYWKVEGKKENYKYWRAYTKALCETPRKFVSNRDMAQLPDVVRAFIPLTCVHDAYKLEMAEVKNIFFMMFFRMIIEWTSEKFKLSQMFGLNMKEYGKVVDEAVMKDDDAAFIDQESGEVPAISVDYQRLTSMYAMYVVLRDLLKSQSLSIKRMFEGLLNGTVEEGLIMSALRDTKKYVTMTPAEFLGEICDVSAEEGHKIFESMKVLSCHEHTEVKDDLPRHDTKYIFKTLEKYAEPSKLPENVEELRKSYMNTLFKDLKEKTFFQKHKLVKLQEFANKYERLNHENPLEAMRHIMPRLNSCYTFTDDRFETRDDLWGFVENLFYPEEAIAELRALTDETVEAFNFEKWRKNNRQFLPGYQIYSTKNLGLANSFDDYLKRMQRDLTSHYSGKKGRRYRCHFTDKMKAFLPVFAKHHWQEYKIYTIARKHFKEPVDDVLAKVASQFPEVYELPEPKQTVRVDHIKLLIHEGRTKK
eukprot:CAMPEP_0115031942 /NCGR_PEP_ID=MMETSP0216-20121206/38858_1 /TAXON_ID=223996 /ORGANISM="Protocruzia adherens, Strain Boccale" /LENGTH=1092 /DNA_ID=CAMNT_0002409737 /DNA_START=77 /DNA_END=3355 /DNA_ORIENTATION=+